MKKTFMRKQITEKGLFNELGGNFKNLLLTGFTGVGKTYLANKFTMRYGNEVVYFDGFEDEIDFKKLKKEIVKREKNNVSENKFIVLDEIQNISETLLNDENFDYVFTHGNDVGVYVIMITQMKPAIFEDSKFSEILEIELKKIK